MTKENVPFASLNLAFMPFDSQHEKIKQLVKRLRTLASIEEKGQTSYNGKDLNILDKIMERSCDETLRPEDIYEIERLIAKFL